MTKTKGLLAAALTSAALAVPATAQAEDVFDCVLDELDSRIESLTGIAEAFNSDQTAHGSPFKMNDIEATYSHQDKMDIIAECEQSTGQISNGFAEGLTKYSNGGVVTLLFQPQQP